MATPTQPHRFLFKHSLLRLLIVASAVLVGVTLIAPGASADPPVPDTASEAAQRVAQLGRDLEILQEQQNEAQVALDGFVADAGAARGQLEQVNATIDGLDVQVRNVARSAFAGDRLGTLSAMLTAGSPQEFLDRVNTLEVISTRNNGLLVEASDARTAATELAATADAAVAAAQAAISDIATRRSDLESQIASYEDLYAQLTAEEQRAVTGSDGGDAASTASAPEGGVPPGPVSAPTEAARVAVEAAYAQLGDSYSWGAAGPDAFDCSGLTMYVYAQAGVSLPHSSSSQSRMGVPVGRDQLQPGDLLFYYSPVSHVGIYVGNGQLIHAYNYGAPVSLDPIDVWGEDAFTSAVRIVG